MTLNVTVDSRGADTQRKVSAAVYVIAIAVCPVLWLAGLNLAIASTADHCAYETDGYCGQPFESIGHILLWGTPAAFLLLVASGVWRLVRRRRRSSS